jgi:hypothetical protein
MKLTGKKIAVMIAVVAIVGVVAVGLYGSVALAQGPRGGGRGGMMGGYNGGGMMGGLWANGTVTDTQRGGGFGPGYGMMGGLWANGTVTDTQQYGGFGCPGFGSGLGARGNATGTRLAASQVRQRVTDYLGSYDNSSDLKVVEVMEFQQNFYAQMQEKSTGINAFELLIDPYTGNVWPEYGPNMMWNTKYGMTQGGTGGMMRGFGWGGPTAKQSAADMTVTPEQAEKYAQDYLDKEQAGQTAETKPDTFYGYYTIHTLDKDGKTVGMLSVNGYTGRVWYHTWHGQFVNMVETGTQG